MMKTLGYCIFSVVYNICRLFPVRKKLVLCICTHDDGISSNAVLAAKVLKELNDGYCISCITRTDMERVKGGKEFLSKLSFFLIKPYTAARAGIILMDNIFLPFAFLRIRSGVKVIQLWHGTGTIKKFGQDTNTGRLKELEYKANRNITHLIVNSNRIKKVYAGAFGINESKVYPIGLPRTDEILGRLNNITAKGHNKDKNSLYRKYCIPEDKKLVLYAPTFRDDGQDIIRIQELIDSIIRRLPAEYVLGLRLHPFIAQAMQNVVLQDRVYQMSFDSDLTKVMMAADILITDYSSIIFEYCILERPMVFFAYDLEEFSCQGRGFYMDYESNVPGPVAKDGDTVAAIISGRQYNLDKVIKFKEDNFPHLDGRAAERLLALIRQI